tara:strand:+ start:210 stop:608 length:399 start_codon:yes stop_codon:yes gene_type:complete
MSDMIPLPTPTEISQPHWDGCKKGELLVQKCTDCQAYVFIPQESCTNCQSSNLNWIRSSGKGVLYSYTTVFRPQRIEFEVPYIVAIVELEEGWHMLSNLIDCDLDAVKVGMPIEVSFRKMTEEITLPMFKPA